VCGEWGNKYLGEFLEYKTYKFDLVLAFTIALLASGSAKARELGAWPTVSRVISSPFGPRIKESENSRFDFHRGIDIPGNSGDDIYSIADGVVDRVFLVGSTTFPKGGNVVRIKHEDTEGVYFSLYLHLNTIAVREDHKAAIRILIIYILRSWNRHHVPWNLSSKVFVP